MSFSDLLRRQLVFIVGKGGVGRTTVTLGIALEAARRGERVLAVELEGARGLEAALAAQRDATHPPPGLERIEYMAIDGRRALEEYLSLIIPVRRLLKTVFSSTIYQYFVAAAPGLKELMTVGKLWYEADRRNREDTGSHELVLVDCPATGHSLQYLRMPQAALETFGSGLVHREAERVVGLLRDPEATGVVMVTLPEEMPANETCDMYRGLNDLRMQTALLVVNQLHTAPCTRQELDKAAARLGVRADQAQSKRRDGKERKGRDEQALIAEILARAEEEVGWAEINDAHVQRLAKEIPVPTVKLPYLFNEEFGAEEVCLLGREVATQLDAAGQVRPARAARPR